MSELKDILEAAYKKPDALHSCSHFVWHAIKAFDPDQPYMIANELVRFLDRSPKWEEIDRDDSRKMAELAKGGALVVGGNIDTPNGHVIVVYPGDIKESGGYAAKIGGKTVILPKRGAYARCMSRSLGSWPGAKSDGDKTIADPWDTTKFKTVRFWVLISSKPAAK